MNPFEVKTPENLKASEIHELFVDVFTDFGQVKEVFHTFLNGPRGSGKSMMFRYMMPDCQILEKNCNLSELDFFSLYIPIKLTDINLPEIDRLKHYSNTFINEHLLTTYIAIKCLKDLNSYDLSKSFDSVKAFYSDTFLWYVEIAGEDITDYKVELESSELYFNKMIKILEKMLILCKKYYKQVANTPDSINEYTGALCNYLDFLYPLLLELKQLPFMPQDKPIFLLIDDAGYLNNTQTKILNTWVSYRNSSEISLKISTQLDYKSYKTISNKTIDFPHDYSQINIATIYTSSNRKYYNRIESIVEKRIRKYLKKEITPQDFFPPNHNQVEKLKEFYEKIEKENYDENKPHKAKDAARRYASSEYVKWLRGGRSGSTYSYAGFDNLVNVSSGIIRYFLEPASRMFSEYKTQLEGDEEKIEFIPDAIQNDELNEFSRKFLFDEFTKIFEDHGEIKDNERFSKADKLSNLLEGLGGLFSKIFVSDRTERVVFSVALNDIPDKELKEVLDLAITYGYLYQSSIGNKHGTGRCKLYVLSRTLAPYFKLDPTGFKGYKFMNSEMLKISLTEPQRFIKLTSQMFEQEEKDSPQQFLFE